ncbi:hypothetical protein OK006_8371 [Actinobacteria bacterium OK006]|nr:hypothetical protein OK006_8371 [Actinobacteria bacterium OK006]
MTGTRTRYGRPRPGGPAPPPLAPGTRPAPGYEILRHLTRPGWLDQYDTWSEPLVVLETLTGETHVPLPRAGAGPLTAAADAVDERGHRTPRRATSPAAARRRRKPTGGAPTSGRGHRW